jgi:hypothetical protein
MSIDRSGHKHILPPLRGARNVTVPPRVAYAANVAAGLSNDAWSVIRAGIIGSPLSNPLLPRSWRWDKSLVSYQRPQEPWSLTPINVADPLIELFLGDSWLDVVSPLEFMTEDDLSLHCPAADTALASLGVRDRARDPALPLGESLALAGYDVRQVLAELEYLLARLEVSD